MIVVSMLDSLAKKKVMELNDVSFIPELLNAKRNNHLSAF
jgi:hypothetical protein